MEAYPCDRTIIASLSNCPSIFFMLTALPEYVFSKFLRIGRVNEIKTLINISVDQMFGFRWKYYSEENILC